MPWMNFWKKGMYGAPTPAKSWSSAAAQGASVASVAESPKNDDGGFLEMKLGDDMSIPLEMTTGKPAPFPMTITNNDDEALEVVFSVIETPGPDGESAGALEVLGIRPADSVPNKENPKKLYVPAKSTVEAEIALLSPSLPPNTREVTTGATITAEDPSGRTQYTKEPLKVTITSGPAATTATTRQAPRQGSSDRKRCFDLKEVLRTNGHTNTFAEILDASTVDSRLPEGARYTMLAPTDAAFDALTAALNVTKADLVSSPSLDLLILHHLLPERVSVDDLAGVDAIGTVTCDDIGVGKGEDMSVTVSGCAISASDTEVCEVSLYKVDCVLPPPKRETGDALCLPQGRVAEIISGGPRGEIKSLNADQAEEDDYEYDYDYSFDMPSGADAFDNPPGMPRNPTRSFGPDASRGGKDGMRTDQIRGSGSGGNSWDTWEPIQMRVVPRLTPVPDKWSRLNHLANAGKEPVKATFLPPGWKEWITPGSDRCPRQDPNLWECSRVRLASQTGRSCSSPNMLHTCGYLDSSGPRSYQIQPPPSAYRDGFITLGDSYVWQSIEGGSAYCTPATADGASFKGSVYHEAWVEPRSGARAYARGGEGEEDLDVMLFLLQNPLNGDPWEVVSMQTSATPGTERVKRLKTQGQGCFLWVVASASGAGAYDFHLSVSEGQR